MPCEAMAHITSGYRQQQWIASQVPLSCQFQLDQVQVMSRGHQDWNPGPGVGGVVHLWAGIIFFWNSPEHGLETWFEYARAHQ